MFNRAIDKIRDEMAANSDNGYVKVVGEYLTDYLEAHKSEEGKILAEGKTILGSLKVMSDAVPHEELQNTYYKKPSYIRRKPFCACRRYGQFI